MARHTVLASLPIFLALALCVLAPSPALSRLNLPEAEGSATIEGQDQQVLRDFFARLARGDAERSPAGQVRRILLAALPEVYKNGCSDMVAHWGPKAAGTEGMSVSVLHVEGRDAERPVRALVAYACFSTAPEYADRFRDERLASIVIDSRASRLAMMPDERDCEDCAAITRIRPEKYVRIGGKGVVGLSFARTNENPCCKADPARQERVNFYLVEGNGIKRAGSVLKGREEYAGGINGEKTVYSAAVIFKKDMKGNVIGILAPYTVTGNAGRLDKGMIRYGWDNARQEFVKQ